MKKIFWPCIFSIPLICSGESIKDNQTRFAIEINSGLAVYYNNLKGVYLSSGSYYQLNKYLITNINLSSAHGVENIEYSIYSPQFYSTSIQTGLRGQLPLWKWGLFQIGLNAGYAWFGYTTLINRYKDIQQQSTIYTGYLTPVYTGLASFNLNLNTKLSIGLCYSRKKIQKPGNYLNQFGINIIRKL